MDGFDVKLLNLVQRNNLLTAKELGDLVGLSPSSCQRRLKQLRDDRIITNDVSLVAFDKVGRNMTMIVEVTLEREHPDIMRRFKESMRETPEVMQCYYVTGETDFILILTAKDIQSYEAFTQRFFFENPNIKRFHTRVVMDRIKTSFFVPVETD